PRARRPGSRLPANRSARARGPTIGGPVDPAAFDPESLRAWDGFVRRLARELVLDPHGAEDVAQDAWVVALGRGRAGVASLPAWRGGVVRHLSEKAGRGRERRRRREEVASRPEALPSAAEILAREEARARVVEAVRALDEPYRTAVLLRWFEG